jgi:GNAT superfamily N-acetyltransferase
VISYYFEKITREHAVEAFDCGVAPLNQYLTRYAMQNQLAKAAQTYLCLSGEVVVGYFALVVSEVSYDAAPVRLRKGLARHPIPTIILARLAVDRNWQGRGLGASMLKDATVRTLQVADIAGIRALVVHAKDDAAHQFYSHFGFADGFTDPLHLYVLTKELKLLAG